MNKKCVKTILQLSLNERLELILSGPKISEMVTTLPTQDLSEALKKMAAIFREEVVGHQKIEEDVPDYGVIYFERLPNGAYRIGYINSKDK